MPGKRKKLHKPHKSHKSLGRSSRRDTSWDGFAKWYDGWMGREGSKYHRKLLTPATVKHLKGARNILDLGCGTGALAASLPDKSANYHGVDLSPKMIELGKRNFTGAAWVELSVGDARDPRLLEDKSGKFDAIVLITALEDIDELDPVVINLSRLVAQTRSTEAFTPRVVITMRHPCFNIPRLSGWQHDEKRKLNSRKVDRYLDVVKVPVNSRTRQGTSWTYHRTFGELMTVFSRHGFVLSALDEITDTIDPKNTNIPAFVTLVFTR